MAAVRDGRHAQLPAAGNPDRSRRPGHVDRGQVSHSERMVDLASLVLFTSEVDRSVEFYRALGVPLQHEDHGSGQVHFAAELAGVHFAIYPATEEGTAPARRVGGSCFPGFFVTSLAEVRTAVEALGVRIVEDHESMPWGCRIIVEDPDGRAVEINDRTHCDGESG